MEKSLVLIKPDAVQRGLAGEIISRLEKKGLSIVAMKMLHMDRASAQRHYAVHTGKAFFDDLVDFITSGPVIAIVFQGRNAVEVIRQVMGGTDPAKASSGTIRGDFGIDIGHNLVHGSDSLDNASGEIDLFFSAEEILSYDRDLDNWIY
ncbi:MAG: nucleoside-diphosphate kinase [Chloroflexi bacterium]|jgi:nucleoside-diphosphate kinase|nr:nucleoside-diphosphate kinase [Chloroflexota bacterium]